MRNEKLFFEWFWNDFFHFKIKEEFTAILRTNMLYITT